ncbi:MAG: PTH1 family peptidyl-tRNA hydrolase [Chlamydiales bacterium]|jgi:PTH1 family peptidyl-tRNA hydrolase
MEQRLIVGLGNPGRAYEMTRHNIGFLVVEAFARKCGLALKPDSRFLGTIAKGQVRKVNVHLLMPMTYMNESGRSVRKYCDYFKISPEQLIVISDDISLDFERMRLRERGSSGGHNGHKSLQSCLGTTQYARLKMGVGTDRSKDLSDHVLGRFSRSEEDQLDLFVEKAVGVVDHWLDEDIEVVMNDANATRNPKCPQSKNGVNPIPQNEEDKV